MYASGLAKPSIHSAMKPIKNVLLDWSGTLANDLPPVVDATNKVLGHYGKAPLSVAQFKEEFCLPFTDFYDRKLPGVSIAELDPLYTEFFDASTEIVEELPGARDFLEFCRSQELRVFLLSSIKAHHFDKQAADLGFRDFFEHPHTEVWNKTEAIAGILQRHALTLDETLFAGDMIHDIDTARHGGVLSVATLTGYDSEAELRSANPDLVVDDLSQLPVKLQWQGS